MAGSDSKNRVVEFFNVGALQNPEVTTRLRLLMASHGLNQQTLAAKSGISEDEVARLLAHPVRVKLAVISAVCSALKITINQLCGEFDLVTVRSA